MSSGIIVGKSGTTINLNGHTMTGPTSGTGAKGASNHATGNGQQNCYRVRGCS